LHLLVSVIVPFDVLFRMAGWSSFGQFAINTLCILAWSTAIGLAATWTAPRLVRYARARYGDFCNGRYQCSIRELLFLAACERVDGYNDCIPPQYQIELISGGRVMLDVRPTACCGIFGSGDRCYRDVSHAFRDAVDSMYVRASTQNGKVPAKTTDVSSSAQ
jgi:hypothetical protein